MPVWNPFESGVFTNLMELTDTFNRRPWNIGQVGSLGIFETRGARTLKVAIEGMTESLGLLAPIPRGAPAPQLSAMKRTLRDAESIRIAAEATITADELMDVRAYGTEGQMKALEAERQNYLTRIASYLSSTYEHILLGGIQGITKNPNGDTILNFYTMFSQSEAAEVNLELDEATEGATIAAIAGIVRGILNDLGMDAVNVDHIHCFTDATGFDNLQASVAFRNSFKFDSVSAQLRQNTIFAPIRWQNVVWEEYRLGNSGFSGGSFLGAGKFRFFPVFNSSDQGIYHTRWIKSDSIDEVGDGVVGLPRYIKTKRDQEYENSPRWIGLMGESNPLVYCSNPRALRKGDDGVA